MAIMRQQARFVDQLYATGMVDDNEVRRPKPYVLRKCLVTTQKDELMQPVDAHERALSHPPTNSTFCIALKINIKIGDIFQ